MKHNALAVILTLIVAAILAAALWWDQQRTPPTPERSVPQPELPRGKPVPPPPLPSSAPRTEPGARGLYRCDGKAGTTYQSAPCAAGTHQAQVGAGTFSVVSPPPAPPIVSRPREDEVGGKVGFVARTPRDGDGNEALCAELERAIRNVDADARRESSAQRQDWLKEKRRRYVDRMWQLKCGM